MPLSALAPTYETLAAARVLTALAHGSFFGVGAVVHDHPGHLPRPQPGFPVHRHGPEGGDEGLGGGQGHAAHRYPMGRTEDQHPPDGLAALQEFGVGAGRHGPGIDVAGVGHDQGLG